MPDLSSWQRSALDALFSAGPESYVAASARSWLRDGCEGLTRRGLAERAPAYGFAYRITPAGVAEWKRRHGGVAA